MLDLWGIEEAVVVSQPRSKHEDSKDPTPDKSPSTLTIEQEPARADVSGEITTDIKEQASHSGVTAEKQEKPVITPETSSDVSGSEKLSEGKSLELENKESLKERAVHKSDEVLPQRTEQSSQPQPNNQEKSDDHHHKPSLSELSKTLTEDATSNKTDGVELQTTLHKRENSSGSVDSSWSKLSEEDLQHNGDKEGMATTTSS